MDGSEFLPYNSPPRPIAPFDKKGISSVPDISLLENDYKSSRKNSKTMNTSSSNKPHEYPQDLRLKFYQIIQSNANYNSVKRRSVTDCQENQSHNKVIIENKNHRISPKYEQNFISKEKNSLKQFHHRRCNQDENIEVHSPSSTVPVRFNHTHTQTNSNHGIKKLFSLVEGQSKQLESLKFQMHTLLHNFRKLQENVNKASFHRIDNENESFEPIVHQQKQKCNEVIKITTPVNKVSIGVMTSFEFTIRNKLNNSDGNGEPTGPLITEEINEGEKSHGKTINSLMGPLERIVEKSEGQYSEPSDQKGMKIQSTNKVDHYEDNDIDKLVRTSSIVDWTFYNNVLGHVNEILNNSPEVCSPQVVPYDTIKQLNRTHRKTIEAAFTDMTNVITSSVSDKIIAFDASYYPRVNYQTNHIQTSNSIADTNTSIQMRALALKYLGDKYLSRDNNLSHLQKQVNDQTARNSMLDFILENSMSVSTRNYMDKHKLMGNENAIEMDSSVPREQNILDISILKRQPKLL